MIALFSFLPSHCPSCGKSWLRWDSYSRQDFFAGASHTCDCGMSYGYCDGEHLLDATRQQGGDMHRYVDADGSKIC